MEINTPDQFMKALANLMMTMNRKQRKQFLHWVKERRTQYDFTYPEGYKPPVVDTTKGDTNVQSSNTAEPVIAVPSAPVLLVPEPGVISTTNPTTSGEAGCESTSSADTVPTVPS